MAGAGISQAEEFQIEMPFDEDGGMEEGEEVEIEITEEPVKTVFPADDEIPPDLQKISDELRENSQTLLINGTPQTFQRQAGLVLG